MKKVLCLALVLLCAAVVLAQQSNSNPVSDSVRSMIDRQAKNMTAAAEEMPADKYSYKPTPQQMSFAELVEHIAKGNQFYCSKLTTQAPPAMTVSEKDSKEKLVTAMKDSFTYCDTALKGVKDSQLGEEVSLFGGHKGPKAAALLGLTNGWADHYGMASMYLRLNGLLPPTAKKTETASKE
ncbi:MAG TPA: DinB family protein [Terriglobales bacterium]|jgi:uncharacterized damage-inducible protein DinB|nr:DinB family protein [Terriglobales bacterium]